MFLHLGADTVVPLRSVIAILDLKITSGDYKKELERINNGLGQVKVKFLEIFNPKKDGDSNGNN